MPKKKARSPPLSEGEIREIKSTFNRLKDLHFGSTNEIYHYIAVRFDRSLGSIRYHIDERYQEQRKRQASRKYKEDLEYRKQYHKKKTRYQFVRRNLHKYIPQAISPAEELNLEELSSRLDDIVGILFSPSTLEKVNQKFEETLSIAPLLHNSETCKYSINSEFYSDI